MCDYHYYTVWTKGSQKTYLLDTRFIKKADKNNLISPFKGYNAATDSALHNVAFFLL